MTKPLFLALALVLAAGAAPAQTVAQSTYKCVDARGKVTYTSTPCEEAGQKGDVVRDRMNTVPADRPPAPHYSPSPDGKRDGGTADGYGRGTEPQAAPKPPEKPKVAPERRCFQTKSGTRCNDDPNVDDPTPQDERSKGENRAQ